MLFNVTEATISVVALATSIRGYRKLSLECSCKGLLIIVAPTLVNSTSNHLKHGESICSYESVQAIHHTGTVWLKIACSRQYAPCH